MLMNIQMLNIHEAKTKLSSVLMHIEKTGESVVICRNGRPVAELGPLKQRQGSRLGVHPVLSNIQINYDPIEDLDEAEWGDIE
jgi:antitoxin (DNA-binding transcriptional repressor) of toxin-antitoxin stability system